MRIQQLARRFFRHCAGLGTVLFLVWTPQSFGQDADANAPNASATQDIVISEPDLFQVMNPAALQLGNIMDFAKRDIKITLRNVHSAPLHIERIRVTCSCLAIESEVTATLLKPQEEISFIAKLDAAEIKPGPFSRMVLVEVKGHDIILVYINGTVQPMLRFAPGQVLNLGTFAGRDVPWERSITITSTFPAEQTLLLQPPTEDELFNYELLSESPQVFKLSIRPKLPLPIGKLHHLVRLPVSGVDNYGPVVVAVGGTVTGWQPVLESEQLNITLSELQPGEAVVKEIHFVVKEQSEEALARPPFAIRRRQNHNHSEASTNTIAKEEFASDVTKQIAFWEGIAAGLDAPRLPPSATMTKTAQADSVLVTLSFPADFFTQRRRQIIPFTYNKNSCGMLTIIARP
ncbi:MAG: DUF1573 domain-containing protein [Lentisphaeria bacterium]|jgi:hypothetical protein